MLTHLLCISLQAQTSSEYSRIARSEMVKGEYNSALKILVKGIKLFPQDANLNYQAGATCWHLKQYSNAQNYFNKAYELDSTYKDRILRINKNFQLTKNSNNENEYRKLIRGKILSFNETINEINKFVSANPDWHQNNKLLQIKKILSRLNTNIVGIPLNQRLSFANNLITNSSTNEFASKTSRFEINFLKKRIKSLEPSQAFKFADRWYKIIENNPYSKEVLQMRTNLMPKLYSLYTKIGYGFKNFDVPTTTEKKYRVVDPLFEKAYIEETSVTHAGYSYDKIDEYYAKGTIVNNSNLNLNVKIKVVRKDNLSEGPGIWRALSDGINLAGGSYTSYKSKIVSLKPGESKTISLQGSASHRIDLEVIEITVIN